MESWNSVRIKFNVTREAADKLKELVESNDNALRNLGILSVQIDNDKIVKLNLASSEKQQAEIIKKNDTLTKLLERTSPPSTSSNSTSNLPFIVNSNRKRLDNNNLVLQSQQQIIHQPIHQPIQQQAINLPSTSQQQNDIVDRRLAYLNQTNNLKTSPNIKLATNDELSNLTNSTLIQNRPLTINQQQQINSPQIINTSPSIGNPIINKNLQTFSYVNMQQQPINQQQQINHQLTNKNLIRPQTANMINLNNSKININQAIPTQNVLQQIQLKYPPQSINQQHQQQTTTIGNLANNNSNLIGNNIISMKQPYVRNPNVKLNQININSNQIPINQVNQLNSPNLLQQPPPQQQQQQQQQTTLTLNSQLNQTTNNNNASNVALTSPLLVNLLQSDVNDHYNSSNSNASNHLPLTTNTLNNNINNISNNNSNPIKEPPAKKTKSKRKPKDKPPDQQQQLNSITTNLANNNNLISNKQQTHQLNKISPKATAINCLTANNNEITINKTTINSSPSNIQYHQYDNKHLISNAIVNSSIITIPQTTVTLR